MKNLFLFISVLFFSNWLIANIIPPEIDVPKITKFEISNIEVLNLDVGYIGNYKFKRNNCEDGGYSFFSPFYEQPQLIGSTITSTSYDKGVEVTVKGDGFSSNFKISNIKISNNNSIASIDIIKGEVTYKSKIYGKNLSEDYIVEEFSDFNENSIFYEEDCPPCVVIGVIAIAAICESAQSACSPCNGNLLVYACGCSCEVHQD